MKVDFPDYNAQYYARLEKNNRNCQAILHDFINHLSCIRGLIELGDKEKLDAYFETLSAEINHLAHEPISGHSVLDVVLNDKRAKAIKNEIDFEFYNDDVSLTFISDLDLCVIFGNILDNAIDSCLKSIDKTISIDIYRGHDKSIVIKITNSCQIEPKMENGSFISDKEDGKNHGIGLKSIRSTVLKYDGQLDLYHDLIGQSFVSLVTLYDSEKKQGILA